MKRIFAIAALALFSTQALAEGYLSCSNGTIDEQGDGYFQIDVLEDGLEFFPYEGSFTIDATEAAFDAGTFSVVNRTTTLSVEGEEVSTVVNAMLILDETAKTLNVAISYDKGPFASYEMTCVEK
jgi:hypothetical protein